MKMGRPLKWESPEEITEIIDSYFEETSKDEITLTGLCLALETNKQTLANYQEKPEFNHIINIAKMRIENAYEISLRKNGRSGDIFALKNFGWSDRQEIEHSGKIDSDVNVNEQREKLKEKLSKIANNTDSKQS